ncbi:MAG TPA: response regulator [Candidatus Nanoarchaeia archaeon]|nr:response regulator [Candidatus Nanoarchaeia archaeon]
MPGQIKILLVDDDPMVVRMYQRKLTLDGFNLALAYNGEDGLAALKKDQPDIILLDIMMPKMNGIEMLKKVKADQATKNIPVVILTNLGDREEDIQKSRELGACDYWVKANTPLKEITERIRKILAEKIC